MSYGYGFGPVTDAVLSAVADRHDASVEEIITRLNRRLTRDDDRYASADSVLTDTVRDWIESEAWDEVLGPAVDQFDDRLFPEETSR